MVISFRNLGRVISAEDKDWPAVFRNSEKVRVVWRRMVRILSREGAEPRVSRFFFKSMVQSVLLFGAQTWLVAPRMGRVLGGIQDQVERRLMGSIPQQRAEGKWEYTLSVT